MDYYFAIIFFVLGSIVGSFLNVVINRFNTGRTVIGGRSFCPNCAQPLSWTDLIPILSWFALGGKCRNCKSKISIQYPLVEFATGIIFVSLYQNFMFLISERPLVFSIFFGWSALIISILIVISAYDIKHKIIPDFFSYTFAGLALVQTLFLIPILKHGTALFYLDLLAGPILFLPFYLLWKLSKGTWIGLGDGKLVIGIGWFLGFIDAINAIIMAFWIGAIFSLIILLIDKLKKEGKNITMKTEIPFGPFLVLATVIQFFFRTDLIGLSFFL